MFNGLIIFDRPDFLNRDSLSSRDFGYFFDLRTKKRETISDFSFVSASGFEPETVCLEGRCSIQLSYAPEVFKKVSLETVPIKIGMLNLAELRTLIFLKFSIFFVGVAGFEPATSWSQTRRDDRTTLHPEFLGCGG